MDLLDCCFNILNINPRRLATAFHSLYQEVHTISPLYGEKRVTFNFLGFTFYNGTSRQGKYMVGCRTQSQRLNTAMNKVTTWCKENRHQAIVWQARYLNAMLQGHYNYYGVTSNFKSIAAFYRHVIKVWHRYLSRRSQRAKLDWTKYMCILKTHPLKKAYLPHTIYTTS